MRCRRRSISSDDWPSYLRRMVPSYAASSFHGQGEGAEPAKNAFDFVMKLPLSLSGVV